jgi:hypothetical protein
VWQLQHVPFKPETMLVFLNGVMQELAEKNGDGTWKTEVLGDGSTGYFGDYIVDTVNKRIEFVQNREDADANNDLYSALLGILNDTKTKVYSTYATADAV